MHWMSNGSIWSNGHPVDPLNLPEWIHWMLMDPLNLLDQLDTSNLLDSLTSSESISEDPSNGSTGHPVGPYLNIEWTHRIQWIFRYGSTGFTEPTGSNGYTGYSAVNPLYIQWIHSNGSSGYNGSSWPNGWIHLLNAASTQVYVPLDGSIASTRWIHLNGSTGYPMDTLDPSEWIHWISNGFIWMDPLDVHWIHLIQWTQWITSGSNGSIWMDPLNVNGSSSPWIHWILIQIHHPLDPLHTHSRNLIDPLDPPSTGSNGSIIPIGYIIISSMASTVYWLHNQPI